MKSNPFSSVQTTVGVGAWPSTSVTLANMMWLFYHVRNFKVHLAATDTGSFLGLSAGDGGGLLNQSVDTDGASYGAAGISQRRTENAADLLNDLDAANHAQLADPTNQTKVQTYKDLLNKAMTTAAPGEPKTFLRAIDSNTSGIFPIFYFSGGQMDVRIDMGSVKKSGDGYNPACYCTAGTVGSSVNGLDIIGYVTVVGMGGLQIPIYDSTGGNLGFASGEMTPNEVYDDLVFSPGKGTSGTQVQIAMPVDPKVTDSTKQKCFTGFHNVVKVTYDGYDVTSSFNKTSKSMGTDPQTHTTIVNETCTLTVPKGARSHWFTFICEGLDDYKVKTYDQYTLPQQFIVTD